MENVPIEEIDTTQFLKHRGKSGKSKEPWVYGYVNAPVGSERGNLIEEYRENGLNVRDLCFYLLKTYKTTFFARAKKVPEVPTKN